MSYEQAKASVFATAKVPDGYFGATQEVGIALLGRTLVAVAPCGFYRLGLPDVGSVSEAWWLLENHPTARNIKQLKAQVQP